MTYIPLKYKVYRALLTQNNTSAPTANILENTTGVTVTFSYISTGVYHLVISGKLPDATKVFIDIKDTNTSGNGHVTYAVVSDTSTIQLSTFNSSLAAANSVLVLTPIEILIYN